MFVKHVLPTTSSARNPSFNFRIKSGDEPPGGTWLRTLHDKMKKRWRKKPSAWMNLNPWPPDCQANILTAVLHAMTLHDASCNIRVHFQNWSHWCNFNQSNRQHFLFLLHTSATRAVLNYFSIKFNNRHDMVAMPLPLLLPELSRGQFGRVGSWNAI